jgi:hypothetical protein
LEEESVRCSEALRRSMEMWSRERAKKRAREEDDEEDDDEADFAGAESSI